ncbi:MAG TPA: sigma 54-interacting transcriptional regulator [Burkholderiales bacterium]|nr:sigma 54-interacting transcriptional regulator [Burkholderiales bacterium]
MSSAKLKSTDREFLSLIGGVVFGNPFSEARDRLIVQLAPGAIPGDLTTDREALARVVGPRIQPWLQNGHLLTRGLSAQDRALLEPAVLYVCYHRYVSQLDAMIERQASQGGTPLTIAFADDAIAELVRGGIDADRAERFFAFYFQLRRAFYFIQRDLTGECPSMRRFREALWNNIFTHDMRGYEAVLWNRLEDFSTLLLGETGTGKGSAAAAIGRSGFIPYVPSQRRFATNFAEAFISINLSQFPESLIESELFGHRKGAFTGAIDNHEGVFSRCNAHGSLFLDEIGEVSIPVQIKLLQVLQERIFTPLGGHEKKRFAGRVIAATNRALGKMREDGHFREDFFYRLCSDVIEVPTLRQRVAESPAELQQLVERVTARITGAANPDLVARVMEAFERDLPRDYAWPGNVRELEQAVRRILLTGRYAALAQPEEASTGEEALAKWLNGDLTAADLLARYCWLLYQRLGTYAEVAKRTGLDPRTSRKYVEAYRGQPTRP